LTSEQFSVSENQQQQRQDYLMVSYDSYIPGVGKDSLLVDAVVHAAPEVVVGPSPQATASTSSA
jgi:hypothetical protein